MLIKNYPINVFILKKILVYDSKEVEQKRTLNELKSLLNRIDEKLDMP